MHLKSPTKTIAIDCDGVLLDYHAAYAHAWQRVTGPSLNRLRATSNEDFWSTIPAIRGALEVCELLAGLGYELVCVTALEERFLRARAWDLQSLGFPIARVITTDIGT